MTVALETSIIIKAPRAKVFAAWVEPELMRKWFAPGAMTVPSAQADPRPGGTYAITMKGEESNPTVRGEYREVVRDEKLVFTWAWDGGAGEATLVTVLFRDATGGTEVHLKHERFANAESRDRHLQGWNGCLANLATRLGVA
jgi:uncharacterized protein YndB with AHSA1/START domain